MMIISSQNREEERQKIDAAVQHRNEVIDLPHASQ